MFEDSTPHRERGTANGRGWFAPKFRLLGALYLSQYLGISFILAAVPAILRASGTALEDIAWIYGLGLIWSLKFVWAPLVDRFGSKRLGHYRGWLLITQSLLVATMTGAALLDLQDDFALLAACFALITLFAATQDIAADALAVTLLAPDERGLGNSIQMAGGMAGGLLGGGLTLMFYAWLGWQGSMLVLACATAVPLLLVYRHRERPAPADLRKDKAGLRDLPRFLRRPGNARWFVVLLTANLGIGLGYALLNPMLVDLGWSLDRIGFAVNIVGSVAGSVGALIAGSLVVRIGRKIAMAASQALVALSLVFLFAPAMGVESAAVLYSSICVMMLAYAANATIAATLMMDKSDPSRAGTDYTLQYSVGSLFSHLFSASALALAAAMGYAGVLSVGIALCGIALVAIWRYDGFAPKRFATQTETLDRVHDTRLSRV